MTKDQVKKYVESSGGHCPFCGADNIEGEHLEPLDGTEVSLEVKCGKCDKEWREYYKLHDVEERNEEGELVETTEL